MSKGSKRPGWRTIERRYKYLTRQLHAEAEAERKRKPTVPVPSAVNTVAAANGWARARMIPIKCQRCFQREATFTAQTADGNWDPICRQCITLDDRWFCGKYPCGLVYADRAIEEHGDYKRVAFLPYSTLVLDIDDPASPLIERVRADAAKIQAMRGQPYQIAGNMTITLGER